MRIAIVYVCLFLSLHACKPDPEEKPILDERGKVWHICEGTFNWATASLGYWDSTTNTYSAKVFEAVNQEPLGDVFQSMTSHNGKYWLVVNNSGKIILVDKITLQKKGEINGLTSPRNVAFHENKAFISDLYADKINIYDAESLSKIGELPTSGWVEHLYVHEDELWCFYQEAPSIHIYNARTLEPLDTIKTAIRCTKILPSQNQLVAMYEGSVGSNQEIEIYKIDLSSHKILNRYTDKHGSHFSLTNHENGYASVLSDGIQFFSSSLEPQERISVKYTGVPYGFGTDPKTGHFFLSTSPSYTDNSKVYVLDERGTELHVYRAGINCNGFFFE